MKSVKKRTCWRSNFPATKIPWTTPKKEEQNTKTSDQDTKFTETNKKDTHISSNATQDPTKPISNLPSLQIYIRGKVIITFKLNSFLTHLK